MKRKSTGKRLRFKVFERDAFTCQYCGKRPPEVILHADHIVPVSKGGENEIENLLTACADCNLGKATMEIGQSTPRTEKNFEELQERYDQLEAFYKLQKKLSAFKEDLVDEVIVYWEEIFEGSRITGKGKASFKTLLNTFNAEEIKDAIDITCTRGIQEGNRDGRFRYMCGVLHNKRKQDQNG